MKKEKKGIGKKVLVFFLILIILFIIIMLYSHFVGTKGLIVKEYKVTDSSLPKSFYGFKIAHISDLHYGRTINENELKKIVERINILKPDVVVLTGDLLDKDTKLSEEQINKLIKQLKKIKVTISKFAITGNHDSNNKAWATIIKDSNFINLNDTYELIYNNGIEPIMIAGLSSNLNNTVHPKDKMQSINDYIDSIKDIKNENIPKFKILIMHEPDYIEKINYETYNIILAGHSHNGQVRLPFIGAIVKPVGAKKYYDEYYSLDNTDLYISSGLGTSNLDFRLFNKPSFNFYRITNK